MKRIISALLVVIVLFSGFNLTYAENVDSIMQKTRVYKNGQFTDVNKSDWFYNNVISAYEYGIVSGMKEDIFNPNGNMKICEAIVIAARINSIAYKGNLDTSNSGNEAWYKSYVDYAENSGIISKSKFDGRYEETVTRAEFVYIMANSVDREELSNENPYSKTIPDMKPGDYYYDIILKTIKAGVISGKDAEGNFCPNDKITRAEAAAVLNRIIERNARKSAVRNLKTPQTNPYDRTEFYEENILVPNYGNHNEIYSLYAAYLNEYYESLYCYIYKEKQLNSYFDAMREAGYNVKQSQATSYYVLYECEKMFDKKKVYIRVFKDYKQVWINVAWNDEFIKFKKQNMSKEEGEDAYIDEREAWDKSVTYLENGSIKNYGQLNRISSITRIVDTNSGSSRMKYTYNYDPTHLLNYYSALDYSGFTLQPLTVDSNPLFLDCTYKSRNTTVRIFVDLVENTVTIEFPKLRTSEI